jgi:hypothetical protein
MATKTPKNVIYFKPSEIHLVLQEDGTVQSSVKNLSFDMMLRMTIPFIVKKATEIYEVASKQTSPQVPALTKQQLQALKESMYDTMNLAFTNALDLFAPEIEARPHISTDALLKAQNELLEEEMKKAGFLKK